MESAQFDDETLMAFADGELDPETRGLVARAAAADPEIAARIEDFRRSRKEVRALFDALVPRSAAEPSTVVPLRPRARSGQAPTLWPIALAAGIAALAAFPAGYLLAPGGGDAPSTLSVAAEAPPELAAALGRLASGEEAALSELGALRPIASFLDGAGRLCREFEIDRPSPVLAVACAEPEGWRVGFAVVRTDGDDFAPAAGLDAVEGYLHAIDVGPPLDPEEERRRLSGLD